MAIPHEPGDFSPVVPLRGPGRVGTGGPSGASSFPWPASGPRASARWAGLCTQLRGRLSFLSRLYGFSLFRFLGHVTETTHLVPKLLGMYVTSEGPSEVRVTRPPPLVLGRGEKGSAPSVQRPSSEESSDVQSPPLRTVTLRPADGHRFSDGSRESWSSASLWNVEVAGAYRFVLCLRTSAGTGTESAPSTSCRPRRPAVSFNSTACLLRFRDAPGISSVLLLP